MKFEPHSNNTWSLYDQMTEKAGSKLEISTIQCRLVHNYWPPSSGNQLSQFPNHASFHLGYFTGIQPPSTEPPSEGKCQMS